MATETRGRSRTYSKPEDLRAEILRYFEECQKARILPDYPGMVIFLKFRSKAALEDLANPEHWAEEFAGDEEKAAVKAKAYGEILEEAALRRESYLVRVMASDNKRAQEIIAFRLFLDLANGTTRRKESLDRERARFFTQIFAKVAGDQRRFNKAFNVDIGALRRRERRNVEIFQTRR